MASRRKGRILAFQALYSWEAHTGGLAPRSRAAPSRPESGGRTGSGARAGGHAALPPRERRAEPGRESSGAGVMRELLEFPWLEQEKRAALDEDISGFSRLLITGTIENIGAIDRMIVDHLEHWDFARLNRVDLAILRMSAYTLMFQSEIAPSIVINEAIGISKEFGTDDSYRFVNGVLDSIRRTLGEQALPQEAR